MEAVTSPAATLLVPGLVALALQLGLKSATRGAAARLAPVGGATLPMGGAALPMDFSGLTAC